MLARSRSAVHDGKPFKLCARDESGVIVTIIADNYFGYCKKEVKTQISYSANLFGAGEEEHSGGARAYVSYDEGQEFVAPDGDSEVSVSDVIASNPGVFEPHLASGTLTIVWPVLAKP